MLRVHSYESMGTYDGPGLRFVVFLQGCNFRCLYCANPDTIECGVGEEVSIDEVHRMVVDMREFFGRRGGVTFSGGEPTLQASALIPLVERFKREGINVCVDTNGGVWNDSVEELFSLVDLVMLDVKQIHPERHKALTERSNNATLRAAKWLEQHSRPFWIRYVLVPGLTDSEDDLRALGDALGSMKQIKEVQILPYHRLGVHKYEAMGLDYKLADAKENTPEQLSRAEAILSEYFDCVVVC